MGAGSVPDLYEHTRHRWGARKIDCMSSHIRQVRKNKNTGWHRTFQSRKMWMVRRIYASGVLAACRKATIVVLHGEEIGVRGHRLRPGLHSKVELGLEAR